MKKAALTVGLVALIFLEIYLCTAFLPANWQHALNNTAVRILPRAHDQWDITHPAFDHEIDQVFRDNPVLSVGFYALVTGLLGGNTVLLVWVWRIARRAAQARGRQQA